jgi:hypothetical protein
MFTKENTQKVSAFIVGAQKSGTTTIHEILSKEEDISLPSIKETHFFCDEERFALGDDWYHRQFDKTKKIWVEVDPDYTRGLSSLKRIKEYNDAAKIIFIYREPLARAVSQWRMNKKRNIETESFESALRLESERLANSLEYNEKHYSYHRRSSYFQILQELLLKFDNNSILLVNFESFISDEKYKIYTEVAEFLGFSSKLNESDLNVKANEKSQPRSKLVNKLLWGKRKWKFGKLIPFKGLKLKIAILIDKANSSPVKTDNERIQISEDIKDTFNKEFQAFIELATTSGVRVLK